MNAPLTAKQIKQIEVELPTLHLDQVNAWDVIDANRFSAIRCGRRWGKTELGKCIAGDGAIHKESIGWFAPSYRVLSESFTELAEMLKPVRSQAAKPVVIRTISGGRIDFWSLENEDAGRSRKYHKVIIDEGAFTKANMIDIWERAIRPTLLDYSGKAIVLSNTNGLNEENFFWRICNLPKYGFTEYHAPTTSNPILPLPMYGESEEAWLVRRKEELDKLKKENHPLVYRQEYLAEFVDWSGIAFFERDRMLVDGQPYIPKHIDSVFVTIDSAVKTGKEHDGTAVIYWGYSKNDAFPLCILDWDVVQIEGALLESWLPGVYTRLNALASERKARMGSLGAFIEDKSSGMILLQQAKRRGWQAQAIDSKLTSVGKDERAISVSGYVYQGKVKLGPLGFNKTTTYKGIERNHLLAQVVQFRIGDKEAAKRADDLLDCFCYGIAIALGDIGGF